MPTNTFRAGEPDWRTLRKLVASSFRPNQPEAGAIGLVGRSTTGEHTEFLLAKILIPKSGDIKVARDQALVFDSRYIRRAHLEMRQKKLSGLVFFHTHPFSDETVSFSRYDDIEEPQLVSNLQEIEPSTTVVSIVLGKQSQCGRAWLPNVGMVGLDRLIVVGEHLQDLPLNGQPEQAPPAPSEIFSRGAALTAAGALNRLAGMTAAVIGASGTGSLMCELLARAGCRHILLIDFDISKEVNLNRILYVTKEDVEKGLAKVDAIKRGIEALGLGCKVEVIRGNVLDRNVVKRLREADVIIGCLDRSLPRELLGKFAFQYLRPYIDVGSEIGGDEAGIVAVNARANYIAPGRYCLQCAGIITSRELRHESLSRIERGRVVALGYSKDLVMEKPAVMDINMHSAGYGMMLLRHILQPFLVTPLPVTISENLVTYRTVQSVEPRAADPSCPICRANPYFGFGDSGPDVGFGKEVLAVILDPEDLPPGFSSHTASEAQHIDSRPEESNPGGKTKGSGGTSTATCCFRAIAFIATFWRALRRGISY